MKFYLISISFFNLTPCNLREVNSVKVNIIKDKDTMSYDDYMDYMGHNGLDPFIVLRNDSLCFKDERFLS